MTESYQTIESDRSLTQDGIELVPANVFFSRGMHSARRRRQYRTIELIIMEHVACENDGQL